MKNINLLIKPASNNCNMCCKYCFYEDVSNLRELPNRGIMSTETLENIVKSAFASCPDRVSFSFQGGEPTWDRILNAFKILQTHHVETNLLCVVTKDLAMRPKRAYRTLKNLGCWYEDWSTGDYTSIRLFDDYVHVLLGQPTGTCATSGICGQYFVCEADGSVYPCDFFVLDQYYLGNINEQTFKQLKKHPLAFDFLQTEKPAPCKTCEWFFLCHGGCKRDYTNNAIPENYYCESFQTFFEYAYPRLKEIALEEAKVLS